IHATIPRDQPPSQPPSLPAQPQRVRVARQFQTGPADIYTFAAYLHCASIARNSSTRFPSPPHIEKSG
ncbi:hypothetical protein, partial [Paraburkholderia sp. BL18I3N2]|uniref:hypothetical protein n=1 Tax=Paraburkholderia sp. BL18I3N2 TaxID=1938799 RepID=UPI001C62F7F2